MRLPNQDFTLDRANSSAFRPWIPSGREKTVEYKTTSTVKLGPLQIAKKWVIRDTTTKLVIHQNQSGHRHHKSRYLAARHYISHISLPCSLVSSRSHSLHHFALRWISFLLSSKHFHFIHQVTEENAQSTSAFLKINLLALWKAQEGFASYLQA